MKQVDEKFESYLTQSRDFIKILASHETHPLGLDYSESSLSIVQGFIESINKNVVSQSYFDRSILAMAVYAGDMLMNEIPTIGWHSRWNEEGGLEELIIGVPNKSEVFLLNMILKARRDPNNDNVVKKYPLLLASLQIQTE